MKNTNWVEYKKAPAKLLGLKRKDAVDFLVENNFPFGISIDEGKQMILPRVVMIRLEIENNIVIAAELDGKRYEVNSK